MKTPVRIQPPSNTMKHPTIPMLPLSRRPISMPQAPPQPLLNIPHPSSKATPSVSDPRISTSSELSTEWWKRTGRRRRMRAPIIVTMIGTTIPNKPNERPTSISAVHAPRRPQGLSIESSKLGFSLPMPCSAL